jgi:hypothetical protein
MSHDDNSTLGFNRAVVVSERGARSSRNARPLRPSGLSYVQTCVSYRHEIAVLTLPHWNRGPKSGGPLGYYRGNARIHVVSCEKSFVEIKTACLERKGRT